MRVWATLAELRLERCIPGRLANNIKHLCQTLVKHQSRRPTFGAAAVPGMLGDLGALGGRGCCLATTKDKLWIIEIGFVPASAQELLRT